MNAADTSVVVAAFASWHEHHEQARKALDGGLRMIDHCALETYSVLTRLPPPHRCAAAVVRDFLKARFVEPYLRLDGLAYKEFVLALPDCMISRKGPARFRFNGPTLHGLPAEPRFESSTRPFSLRQVFWL